MRLRYSDEDEAFRAELLDWLAQNPPPTPEERTGRRSSADMPPWAKAWQRTLFDGGWLVPGFPPERGGRNATAVQQMIYFEVFSDLGIPRTVNPQGLSIVAAS
ncbi:MAG TPA: acyl-CoA dehydrogenase family protein, partial [Acidimicrobiales bacterium]